MTNKKKNDGVHVQVGNNIGGSVLIGNFTNNDLNLNSNNQINTTSENDGQPSKEELKKLIQEFYTLMESSQEVSQEEKADSMELMQLNEQFIESGQPKNSMIKSLVGQLDQLKSKLTVNSPLLTNIGSLAQILSLFLQK